MTLCGLLNTLVRRGASVRLENDDQLRVKPAAVLTDDLRAQVRANKAEIVAFLTTPNPKPCGAPLGVTRAALERGLPITSYGWPREFYPADFASELQEAAAQTAANATESEASQSGSNAPQNGPSIAPGSATGIPTDTPKPKLENLEL